jgi:hypothetical protein
MADDNQAPNNDALTPPHHDHDHDHDHHGHHDHDHHGHHGHDDEDELLASVSLPIPSMSSFLTSQIMKTPSLATISSIIESPSFNALGNDDDDDDKKKRRKEIFRKIVGFVLKYHGLTHAYDSKDLAGNNTFETALETKDGAFGGLNQRVRVEKSILPPCESLLCAHAYTILMTSAQAQLLRRDPRIRQEGFERLLPHSQVSPPPPRILV